MYFSAMALRTVFDRLHIKPLYVDSILPIHSPKLLGVKQVDSWAQKMQQHAPTPHSFAPTSCAILKLCQHSRNFWLDNKLWILDQTNPNFFAKISACDLVTASDPLDSIRLRFGDQKIGIRPQKNWEISRLLLFRKINSKGVIPII